MSLANGRCLPGFEDMKRKEIFGFDGHGHAQVDFGNDGLKKHRLFVTPQGTVQAEPMPEAQPGDVDQIGGRSGRPTVAERYRGVDQL